MKYEFTDYLKTGNSVIDNEHRKLINMVNQLQDACSKGKGRTSMDSAVKFLLDYVDFCTCAAVSAAKQLCWLYCS